MSHKLLIGITVLAIVLMGGTWYSSSSNTNADTASNTQVATPTNPAAPTTITAGSTYTVADVATHNNASSCWATINGKVYDLTKWISQHPGGEGPILSLCGTDGSAAFNGQHGGQRRPASELAGYMIGTLTQ